LNIKGIGPETADSILLYALGKPEMVVDAYTYRVLKSCGLVNEPFNYEQIKQLLITALGQDATNVDILKRVHAAFVEVGKNYCKKRPRCEECPLNRKEGLFREEGPSFQLQKLSFQRCYKVLLNSSFFCSSSTYY